jgi:cell division protein FtsI/penicillin-binding protein 2
MRAGRWLATAALVAGTAGCSSSVPDPQPAAQALADALSSQDLTSLELDQPAGTVQSAFDDIVDGMSPATVEVDVADVVADESAEVPRRTVTLLVTWDLDGTGPGTDVWTYSAEAALTLEEDEAGPRWAVVWSPALVHPDLSGNAVLVARRDQPRRADIVATDGRAIVTARPVARVGLDKVRLGDTDPDGPARQLAGLVGIDPERYVEAVSAAGESAFVEAIVLRQAEADRIADEVAAIEGARALPDELPLAPTRAFARPLLGTVGPATAEVVDASEGAVAATDLVGLSGLQARYDARLRGTPGSTVTAVSPDDPAVTLHTTQPRPGDPLVVTLDRELQTVADDLLTGERSPSALVAIRPSTAELLAVASGPGGAGYSTATLGQYAPGSVFKMVTALALLRSGVAQDDELTCPNVISVDGKQFTNYSDYPRDALGDIPLRRVFAESCNTAFIGQVDRLEWTDLTAAGTALGLAGDADLGFDAYMGDLGTPTSRVEQAAGLIGQGPVLLSPLAAATMAASSVAGPVTPLLLPDVVGEPLGPTDAWDELTPLREMMALAVTDGTARVVADVPGPPVLAKTGTAEFGTDDPPDTHGWMVAVQGDLAVAVFVEQAESGSATAGPILRAFLTQAESSVP